MTRGNISVTILVVVSAFLRLLASLRAKTNVYQLAAAAVWGLILSLVVGIIEYDGPNGKVKAADHWFLATVGLCAIMYIALTLFKMAVLAFRREEKEEIEADD